MTPSTLFKAIHRATGLTREQITSRSRKIELVYARMIVVHYLDTSGMKTKDIAKCVNRDRSTIVYTSGKYKDEYRYNRIFRDMADRVKEWLDEKIFKKTI